jgi:hypothetical protein
VHNASLASYGCDECHTSSDIIAAAISLPASRSSSGVGPRPSQRASESASCLINRTGIILRPPLRSHAKPSRGSHSSVAAVVLTGSLKFASAEASQQSSHHPAGGIRSVKARGSQGLAFPSLCVVRGLNEVWAKALPGAKGVTTNTTINWDLVGDPAVRHGGRRRRAEWHVS